MLKTSGFSTIVALVLVVAVVAATAGAYVFISGQKATASPPYVPSSENNQPTQENIVDNTGNNASVSEEMANIALSSGTKIIDQTGDWISTGDQGDNPSFYPIDFVDIKEVDVGVDENYLYVKATFNGQWPESDNDWPSINGDQITWTEFSAMIDADNNSQTGCLSDGGTEIALEFSMRMNDTTGNPPGAHHGYKTDPSGIEFPEENRYLGDYDLSDNKMIGGPGYNYVTGVYPLENLKLTVGQGITLKMKAESMSERYNHAAFDDMNFLNGPSIVITLGENKTINYG